MPKNSISFIKATAPLLSPDPAYALSYLYHTTACPSEKIHPGVPEQVLPGAQLVYTENTRHYYMGLGRREFMKHMTMALAGAAVGPLNSVAINENYYVNRKLGLIFEKPEGWGFISVHDFGMLREKQILSNILPDEDEEFWESFGSPAVIVTKYPEDLPEHYGIFSPTIQFFVNHKSEFDDIEYESFEEFIDLTKDGTTNILSRFEVLSEKKPYSLNGVKFYQREAKYMFEHHEIDKPLEVELTVLIAEHNNYYYFINMHDSPAQSQVAKEEFRAFTKSLKLI